jgi:hypothetical protein
VAERIGPTVGEITGRGASLDPRLIANWDARSGYLKSREQFDPDGIDELLGVDIAHAASMKRGRVWLDPLGHHPLPIGVSNTSHSCIRDQNPD